MNTPKLQIKIGLQRRRDVMSLQHAQVVWQEHRTMGASEAPVVGYFETAQLKTN